MSRRILFAAAVIAVLVSMAVLTSDDSDAAYSENVRLYVQTDDGYVMTYTQGGTVKEIVEKGCTDLGLTIVYSKLGAIESVGGLVPSSSSENWNIHQWMPLGVHDWYEVGFDEVSDSLAITGTSYCLHISGHSMENGVNVYGRPDFKPTSDGYVFIRFDYGYDSTDPFVQEAFTTEDRFNGFWLKGHGSNMGEVVADAMDKNGFECSFLIGDSNGNDLQYWITSFFGIDGDTNLGGPMDWAYWSQYMYINDVWSYNQKTLGYYDPAVYRYIAIVYIISLNYSEEEGGAEMDVIETLPRITSEESVDAQVKRNMVQVTFELDGEAIVTVWAKYNTVLSRDLIPSPPVPEGMYFTGWGDTGAPITEDTVFRGSVLPMTHTLTYMSYDGTPEFTEQVVNGSSAAYSVIPSRPETAGHTYVFEGWSPDGGITITDLSSVKASMVLTPVFGAVAKQYDVTFVLDGSAVKKLSVAYGQPVPSSEVPSCTADDGYYFTGWGDTNILITGNTEFGGSIKAVIGPIVTYMDAYGGVMWRESVVSGGTASYAGTPVKHDSGGLVFGFVGWSTDGSTAVGPLNNVTSDMTLVPLFGSGKRMFSVTFMLDGTPVGDPLSVESGTVLSESQIPVPDVPPGKHFSGWGNTSLPITEDTVFNGTMVQDPWHTLTFLDAEGGIFGTETVADGASSSFSGEPSKAESESETFSFVGWSVDGSAVADLTSVRYGMTLIPVFESSPKMFKITFFSYDGSKYAERYVEYGKDLTDYPAGPERPDTVDKIYTFRGWSMTLNGYLPLDLTSVTSSKVVYASYTFVRHPYVLTLIEDGKVLSAVDMSYGDLITEAMMTGTAEGYMLRFYRDASLTERVGTSFMISGDTTLYVQRLFGTYTVSETDANGIRVSLTGMTSGTLTEEKGIYTICDLSSFADGRYAILNTSDLRAVIDITDADAVVRIMLYRGQMTFRAADLLSVADGDIEFSIGKGPTSSVRINSALKKVYWDSSFTVTVRSGGHTLQDTSMVTLHFPYTVDPDPSVSAAAWSADANTGALKQLECTVSDGYILFRAAGLPYVVIGTDRERTSDIRSGDPCPYGEVSYSLGGAVLDRMDIDGASEVLHIPSAFEGTPLSVIGPDAFSGVRNVPALVIPDTVTSFSWDSLLGSNISDVYFLGDMPEFSGDVPSSIRVHRASDASGWDEDVDILSILTYSVKRCVMTYYLIGDEITIRSWVSGTDAEIPASINIGGTGYPVTGIGCGAFMDSPVVNVSIPSSVLRIHTRAFYGCISLTGLTWAQGGSAVSIGDEAFRKCIELRSNSDTIPGTVRFIGFEAFRDCHYLRSLTIPDSVTDIRPGAFYNCTRLADVSIGKGLETVPDRCFEYCTVLNGISIPDNVLHIGARAFGECYALSYIDLNAVTEVGIYAFTQCRTLTDVTFGDRLTSVGKGCFSSCTMLRTVTANCAQPSGFTDAFDTGGTVPEGLTVEVVDAMSASWTIPHTTIEEEDDLMESFESRTMPYVIGIMIVLFAIAGVFTWRYHR
ncbi:MAG: leucine-rich repeat protein [Candidatus Methanomethylophilaceae archaeon]